MKSLNTLQNKNYNKMLDCKYNLPLIKISILLLYGYVVTSVVTMQ